MNIDEEQKVLKFEIAPSSSGSQMSLFTSTAYVRELIFEKLVEILKQTLLCISAHSFLRSIDEPDGHRIKYY